MSDQVTPSQSQNPSILKGSNGVGNETQPKQEKATKPPDPPKYVLDDFSQQRINRGQQQINYLIKVVDEKIVVALNQLHDAIARLADHNVDLGPVTHAIKEVSAATEKIAGEFPPGCGNPT